MQKSGYESYAKTVCELFKTSCKKKLSSEALGNCFTKFVKSQDSWDWKGPLQVIHPLLKHRHLELVTQACARELMVIVKDGDLSRQPVPVHGHPHNEKVFPSVQTEHVMFEIAYPGVSNKNI